MTTTTTATRPLTRDMMLRCAESAPAMSDEQIGHIRQLMPPLPAILQPEPTMPRRAA